MLKLLLCVKYLSRKKLVLMSIFAVALSCALLISVSSLFNGFIGAIESAAVNNMGDIVVSAPAGMKFRKQLQLTQSVEDLSGVRAATPVLSSYGLLLLGKGDVKKVAVWGIDLASQHEVTSFADNLYCLNENQRQALLQSFSAGEGFVGIGVAFEPDPQSDEYDFEKVQGYLGKKAVLMCGSQVEGYYGSEGESQEQQIKFKRKNISFTISDLVFSGVHQFDSEFVYLPIEELSAKLYPEYNEEGGLADTIQIRLDEGVDAEDALLLIRERVENFCIIELGWNLYLAQMCEVATAKQLQSRMVAEYRKQLDMLMVIFGIVSCGVILLISCIFYMIVITKRKDIAIIKSFGAGDFTVASIFLSFGVFVGVIGSAWGVGLGYLFVKNVNAIENAIRVVFGLKIWKSSVYMFDKIPNQMDWSGAMWICLAAVCAAVIGACLPAMLAARMKPITILRYE